MNEPIASSRYHNAQLPTDKLNLRPFTKEMFSFDSMKVANLVVSSVSNNLQTNTNQLQPTTNQLQTAAANNPEHIGFRGKLSLNNNNNDLTSKAKQQLVTAHSIPPPLQSADIPVQAGTGCGGTGMNRTRSLYSMGHSISSSTTSGSDLSHQIMYGQNKTNKSIKNNDDDYNYHKGADNSVVSMISIVTACTEITAQNPLAQDDGWQFAHEIRRYLGDNPEQPDFDDYAGLRKIMEPFLRRARLAREHATARTALAAYGIHHHQQANSVPGNLFFHASIASSMGVPYTALRQERPFLFDEHTHPLHTILAETLNVPDLSLLHISHNVNEFDPEQFLLPLKDRERRRAFQSAYDSFVTSHCIPLLHSLAIAKSVFHQNTNGSSRGEGARVTYRYQVFPTIDVVRPGDTGASMAPTCDIINDHSIGCLTFYIPLTPTFGTNCMFVESHPGKENWHPLQAKSVGLGYLFDGARCLRFGLENTTDRTRVSLTFRVIIYRDPIIDTPSLLTLLKVTQAAATEQQQDKQIEELCAWKSSALDDSDLCPISLLEDGYSCDGPGYYDEAEIDLQPQQGRRRSSSFSPSSSVGFMDVVVKKHGTGLLDPDYRSGHPFNC